MSKVDRKELDKVFFELQDEIEEEMKYLFGDDSDYDWRNDDLFDDWLDGI